VEQQTFLNLGLGEAENAVNESDRPYEVKLMYELESEIETIDLTDPNEHEMATVAVDASEGMTTDSIFDHRLNILKILSILSSLLESLQCGLLASAGYKYVLA